MTLNICTKFHENILDGIKVIGRTRLSFENFSERHNFVINAGGVAFFFLSAYGLIVVCICT